MLTHLFHAIWNNLGALKIVFSFRKLVDVLNLIFSFRGLSVNEPTRHSQVEANVVNYNAGADILHKYQTYWSELHQLAEENAAKVQVL